MFGWFKPKPKLQVFGAGLPKTGTTSLAKIFAGNYSAEHEKGLAILPFVSAYLMGETDRRQVAELLFDRVDQLGLEVDVASYLCHFIEPLAERYSEARFVLTVRHCVPWTVSLAHHMVSRPLKPGSRWRLYREARFGRYADGFAPEEKGLEALGYYPLSAMLRYWAGATEQMLDEAPPERTLVLKTEELDQSLGSLSEFLEIPADTLQPAHANRKRGKALELREIPDEFLLRRAEQICGPLMQRLYGPDWIEQTPPELFAR